MGGGARAAGEDSLSVLRRPRSRSHRGFSPVFYNDQSHGARVPSVTSQARDPLPAALWRVWAPAMNFEDVVEPRPRSEAKSSSWFISRWMPRSPGPLTCNPAAHAGASSCFLKSLPASKLQSDSTAGTWCHIRCHGSEWAVTPAVPPGAHLVIWTHLSGLGWPGATSTASVSYTDPLSIPKKVPIPASTQLCCHHPERCHLGCHLCSASHPRAAINHHNNCRGGD